MYGLNEDFRPLVVGDGMSWVAVAITRCASPRAVVHGETGPWGEPFVWARRSLKRPPGRVAGAAEEGCWTGRKAERNAARQLQTDGQASSLRGVAEEGAWEQRTAATSEAEGSSSRLLV